MSLSPFSFLVWVGLATLVATQKSARAERIELAVADRAGIERFGYPVSATLEIDPPVDDVRRMRLLRDGKPIRAQFRPPAGANPPYQRVDLDFADSFEAGETRVYLVEFGPGVPQDERIDGERVTLEKNHVLVRMSAGLGWVWSRKHPGLLRSVKTAEHEYLAPKGEKGKPVGLIVNDTYRLGDRPTRPAQVRVLKDGPFAAAVRYECADRLDEDHVLNSIVELDFVRTKSWARVDWTVDDGDGFVRSLALRLRYNIDGKPTLVDFGAHSYVYLTLAGDRSAEMRFTPAAKGISARCDVWRTIGGKRRLYAGQPLTFHRDPRPEGWVHLMDQQRCVAAALADFAGGRHEDRIRVTADGRLTLFRRYGTAGKGKRRRITFWQHLIPMPVHVGAATSSQSMLAPLHVTQRSVYSDR